MNTEDIKEHGNMEEANLQQCQLFDHDKEFQDFSHVKYDKRLICVFDLYCSVVCVNTAY